MVTGWLERILARKHAVIKKKQIETCSRTNLIIPTLFRNPTLAKCRSFYCFRMPAAVSERDAESLENAMKFTLRGIFITNLFRVLKNNERFIHENWAVCYLNRARFRRRADD